MKKLLLIKNTKKMIYKDIKTNSNLGYVQDMTVTMEFNHTSLEDNVKLEFSTGFKVVCEYAGNKRDHTNSQILTYSYPSSYSEDETHFLHIRLAKDAFYCQTVQTGKSAGGSTWKIDK